VRKQKPAAGQFACFREGILSCGKRTQRALHYREVSEVRVFPRFFTGLPALLKRLPVETKIILENVQMSARSPRTPSFFFPERVAPKSQFADPHFLN
jgi:hypothetical protein